MSPTTSRLLVVDADVVRAAGLTGESVSTACRTHLMAILEICHRVVRTKEIALQWEKHASRFSRKWMFSMYAKKKLDEDLQPREMIIDTSGFSAADSAAVEDDRHLLEAAAAADHIIITRDDRLQTVLGRHHSTKEILGAFVWINPVRDPRSVLEAF